MIVDFSYGHELIASPIGDYDGVSIREARVDAR